MKKKVKWIITIIIILIGIIFISSTFIYEKSEALYGFPIPIKAELLQENEPMNGNKLKSYHWSRASEENGIPFDYEIILKINGWEKGERLGACVMYTKGNHTIDLCSYHKALDVIKRE